MSGELCSHERSELLAKQVTHVVSVSLLTERSETKPFGFVRLGFVRLG